MIKTAQLFIIIFLLAIGHILFANSAFAQTVNPPQDLHNYTQRVMLEVASSMTCMVAGVDAINPSQKCLGVANGKIGPVDAKGGAVGVMGNLIAMTFTPPFHTADYVRYLASNFGVTKQAYAQQEGIGFQSLNPLIEIWKAFRNITYFLFVLVFIAIGFAIMLRIHIDPRTVMTIENQIPKIIIGLILVTFSFAIAGLLIDLMWILIYLSVSIFTSIPVNVGSFANVQGMSALSVANNIGGSGGFFGIVNYSSAGVGGFISGLMQGPVGNVIGAIVYGAMGAGIGIVFPGIGNLVGALVGGAIGGVIGGAGGNAALGFIGSVIAFLIIALALLFALFRLWFSLIKNYVMILLITVLSPFWILGSIVPGSKITFGSFLRELASRLMAFPATIIMFMLGKAFMDIFERPTTGVKPFVPPLIGNPGDLQAIGSLIGLGIILLTPDVVNMVRKLTLDFGPIGGAVGVGAGAINPLGMMSRATGLGSMIYWAERTPILSGILGRMQGPKAVRPKEDEPAPHPNAT